MGLLIDGEWHDQWYDTDSAGGKFVRDAARFRNWVTADGSAGPSGEGGFRAEPGRYHLYVSLACPWAHRTLIFRRLKGLEKMIDVSVVNPLMLEKGWQLDDDFENATGDTLYGFDYLYQLYLRASPEYTGRVTVPVLWDKQLDRPVSNESSEIIRMFNSAFDGVGAVPGDYYPRALREQINDWNERIYERINNGVYKAGFATSQPVYKAAVQALFDELDNLEAHLGVQRYLLGDTLTEADWRLFTTLVRFDAVYHGHFKCNLRRLADYPALSAYVRDLYQVPGVADTVDMQHIQHHYYRSHKTINPNGIVPLGPIEDFNLPHGRDRLSNGIRQLRSR
ncbi:glutathione S-transferase family protein [Parahaliea maris]|uniref:Glutathione S-transferase family protein n=1 Tax=Parahaliea maris TaxID=2716870 RepID=A0A5C9A3D9_9GAMM|nr:glutathione S-transferase family protein [Parahaliea maris]TXS95278.1 glutathione S-transferase family protein [Parahaliea maris]